MSQKDQDSGPREGEALQGMRKVLDETYPDVFAVLTAMAMNYANQGRLGEAEPLLREALEGQRRILGGRHPSPLNSVYNLGCLAALRGSRAGALYWIEQAVDQGYFDADRMAKDSDLESLRGDPSFEALIARASENRERGNGDLQ